MIDVTAGSLDRPNSTNACMNVLCVRCLGFVPLGQTTSVAVNLEAGALKKDVGGGGETARCPYSAGSKARHASSCDLVHQDW